MNRVKQGVAVSGHRETGFRFRGWPQYAAGFLLAAAGAVLTAGPHAQAATLAVITAAAIFAALKLPVFTVTAYTTVSLVSVMQEFRFEQYEEFLAIVQGIRLPDVILAAMTAAIFFKLCQVRGAKHADRLGLIVAGFFLWIAVEVARNMASYGLSAPGEFRSHFFVLVLPVYTCLFFGTRASRASLFKWMVFMCLFLPALCIPFARSLTDPVYGQDLMRLYPAAISFGLMLGMLTLAAALPYGTIQLSPLVYLPVFIAAGVVILLDGHRSVWFPGLGAALVVFIMSLYRSRTPLFKRPGFLVLAMVCMVGATFMVTTETGRQLSRFVLDRGSELFKVGDAYNTTWTWRIDQWQDQMDKIRSSPVTGMGFGDYWGISEMTGALKVSPHNLYVKLLVKTGAVGLLLYLAAVVLAGKKMVIALINGRGNRPGNQDLLAAGLIALVASHIFGMAYAFSEYGLIFTGLGLAAVYAPDADGERK